MTIQNDLEVMEIDELKDYLRNALHNNIVYVEFTKKDGTLRKMKATLKPSLIPEENHPKGKRKVPQHLLPVWSIEDQGWRSITLSNIKKVEVIPE